jgi:hypothetical protein
MIWVTATPNTRYGKNLSASLKTGGWNDPSILATSIGTSLPGLEFDH